MDLSRRCFEKMVSGQLKATYSVMEVSQPRFLGYTTASNSD